MAELGMSTRERLARAVARQAGVKVCPRCHVGIVRGNSGICDTCRAYPIQSLTKHEKTTIRSYR